MPFPLSPLASSGLPSPRRGPAGDPARALGDRAAWPADSFAGQLPPAERTALLGAGNAARFRDNQPLLHQGEAGEHLYLLSGGLVKVTAVENGSETALAVRARGDLVGEFALIDGKPRTATARALGPVTALRIGGSAFARLNAEYPVLSRTLMGYLLAKMRASTERGVHDRTWEARARLASILCELAEAHGEPMADGGVRLPLTQVEIGQLAGVAVSTAERVLKEFRTRGAVFTRYGETIVRDLDFLRAVPSLEEDRG